MRLVAVFLALAYVCDARPSNIAPRASLSGSSSFILNGVDAAVGEFPWQLSQQRANAQGSWSHSCGASLLTPNRALSAAHCVDGASPTIIRVIAGLHDRTNEAEAQISNIASLTTHQQYNQGAETFNNDIAILRLSNDISLTGWIGLAKLPADNSNQFDGIVGIISGWGRNSAANTLPNVLQKGAITIISQADCNQRLSPVSGALTGPGQICLFDGVNNVGSCNGDSGGPLNLDDGTGTVVAGVTSWGIQGGGACLPTYPSVYTRTSNFLAWIAENSQ